MVRHDLRWPLKHGMPQMLVVKKENWGNRSNFENGAKSPCRMI